METADKPNILSRDLTPEAVVAGQLAAYNARDINAFLAYWEADAEIYQHPDILLAKGHGDIRSRHIVRFLETDLNAVLVKRVVMGNRVVDVERVTRNFADGQSSRRGEVDVVAIYDVVEGRIRKAWFLTGTPRLETA